MYNSKSVILCLALLTAFVDIGSCLECYHCDSESNPNCTLTSGINPLDCASNNSVQFKENHLFNKLPASSFWNLNTSYCHRIVMKSDHIIYTCLDGDKENITKICDELKNSPNEGYKIKSCSTCLDKDKCNEVVDQPTNKNVNSKNTNANHTDGNHIVGNPKGGNNSTMNKNTSNRAQSFMSVRLSGLTLIITYLLYKQ